MATESLEPADYQRIFRVLETTADAAGHPSFFDRIRGALARHLGWSDTLVVRMPVGAMPFSAVFQHAAVPLGRQTFRDDPARHQGTTRAMMGIIDAGTAARALICVHFSGDAGPGARDRAILHRLQRHLAPWLGEHLARVQAGQEPAELTRREYAVVGLVAQGMANRQIAERLNITVDTVKKHLTHAMAKTGCTGRAQLALWWHRRHGSMAHALA
ncbi:helix-turn-helix transcriptional regulator [Actinomadura rudentiformis]|uniref:Helix-turn-helix transcriptional regulator n=1 Tax=Actinomadura rudentiformis TaxID=359158 RepID=A0A6H9YMP9_9ACTN|nr:helix-turn-helix transcriptional regulator [Actinomadura rudentiformis]KAB2339992.1 helix-turn-helix transcriptional regulator [Actinomadura rudentiformis]